MDATFDPRTYFSDFYSNFVIAVLGGVSRWTVSGRLGDVEASRGKAPIDIRHLLKTGRVRGAWSRDKECLVTLDELTRLLPGAANCAYFLQSSTDGAIVLDIEPDCPPEIASAILAIPGSLYSEVSMSGHGYHLVFPKPTNYHDFPNAANKLVLREDHGWYEILLDHWVTFTRRPIPQEALDRSFPSPEFSSIEEVYAALASKTRATVSVTADEDFGDELPAIKGLEEIVEKTIDGASPRLKSLDYFGGDCSRWEFSTLGVLHREMRRHLILAEFIHRSPYSFTDQVWLLYVAVKKVLPYRAKHDEQRNGHPFLLERAASMVALNMIPDNDKEY